MNNELKEILKDLEYASGVFDYTITPDKCTLLLDYITNLQQENENLKEHLKAYKKDGDETQERIDKAIEYINLYAGSDNNYCLDYHDLNPLLNILKGDSNENV